jgi:hypothetical protein
MFVRTSQNVRLGGGVIIRVTCFLVLFMFIFVSFLSQTSVVKANNYDVVISVDIDNC